ncbi:MAG: S41 family peptidase [Flavobacteriales bacterium]|nr:S41 family peptidase [Flavobacteriales bacterium]
MNKNKALVFLLLPLIIVGSVAIGIVLGGILTPSDVNDKNILFQSQQYSSAAKLNEILNYIVDMYVDSVDKKHLTEQSISTMLSELDPHSYYIPAKDFDEMNEPLEGNFDGIGVEFRIKDDTVMIISPIANGPSEKLGIKAGDRIIKVDDKRIAGVGITNDSIIKLLKGPRGTNVEVDIVRPGYSKVFHYKITRDEIPIYSVDAPYIIKGKTGYLRITRFSKTTYEEFMQATQKLLKEGMEKLIIDLRGNGGGVLAASTMIADEMLPKNAMIVYTDGRTRSREEVYATGGGTLEQVEIAILINESSASASEVLAGAIQDNDRGVIIGRRSFGKGLVQEQVMWPDGSALRLTVARYYTPTGRCIQKPYDSNLEAYHAEAYNRFDNGELLSADSIHFPDSLKYYTPSGKLVYGGGGIMPDEFVPLDTTDGTPYLYELRYKGILQDFALNYADTERKILMGKYMNAVSFKNKFKVNDDLFNSLIKYAEEQGMPRKLDEIMISKELIRRGIKAAISRNLYNDFGYYVITNEYDQTVQKAIESLN